jgi:hypothetical protein
MALRNSSQIPMWLAVHTSGLDSRVRSLEAVNVVQLNITPHEPQRESHRRDWRGAEGATLPRISQAQLPLTVRQLWKDRICLWSCAHGASRLRWR